MNRALLALAFLCSISSPAEERKSMYVFQDNFWLNLHQFLRGEAYRRSVRATPGLDTGLLPEADSSAWTRAIDSYLDVAKHDVLFDDLSRKIGNALATVGNAQALPESLDDIIGTNTRVTLNSAAPIYRTRVWPARQRDNEAWIESAKTLLRLHETTMAATLARIYRVDWPSGPILVDVVGEVGPNSAITHGGPPGFAAHTQASAGSRRNTGDAPLELLFHEATHSATVEGHIQNMIQEECARQKLQVPENLWHAMIMFTSGAVARQELTKSGNLEYVPYAYRYGQYTPVERSAFERDWQPYLEGKASLEQALHDLVRDAR
ncbi:MAG TPA: hypothetical protein VLY24_02940 [Bryobacteraceae bacterium]|nr:hypothetical protein [Bryobacteraceae bacterium]